MRPAEVDDNGNLLTYKEAQESASIENFSSLDDTSRQLSLAALEAQELAVLGLTPVKGLLLYGPPGCGKTALAREISMALRARAPKIVSAPELLDRWVGGSERLVRELFHDAEAELASVNGDATRSALHVIVIDEIDAVFRKRSSAEDSGEATRSSTVNQILSKLDGVKAIPNVLLIGMTNRRELLDEALLRPGRLEVQIEIPLPDRVGRREILNIHFNALRIRGRLSQPLCSAIDGTFNRGDNNGDMSAQLEWGRKRLALKRATEEVIGYFNPERKAVFDLANDSVTGGFSGADLEGLVRCAGSIALSRARGEGAGIDTLVITLDDVKQALTEVKV
jgi:vesicle-fusing ATPase